MPYVKIEGPDKCVHLCCLIWAFLVRRHVLKCPWILYKDNVGPDQPARMRRLIRTCVVRILHKGPFRALCIYVLCFKGGRVLQFTALWANSADDKLTTFFVILPRQ